MTGSNQRTGVQNIEVPSSRSGQRLDNFLLARLPGVPRSMVYRVIRKGEVRVNGRRAKPFQKLIEGDMVRIPPVRMGEKKTPHVPDSVISLLEAGVIHEDNELLVCNKPSGIAVHGGSGISWGLIDAFRQSRPNQEIDLVHRLDRETSGCLVLAKSHAMIKHLQTCFAQRETRKAYFALLHGTLPGDRTVVSEPLARQERSGERFFVVDEQGKPAETRFTMLDRYQEATLAEAVPVTGRTHQIRVHAAFLNAPCAGDTRYAPVESRGFWERSGLERLFLHAHSLEFEDRNGESLLFSCPMPDELRVIIDRLHLA